MKKQYFFICTNGTVYSEGWRSRNRERFNLEQFSIINRFESRDAAVLMRDVLEERFPRIFYDEKK